MNDGGNIQHERQALALASVASSSRYKGGEGEDRKAGPEDEGGDGDEALRAPPLRPLEMVNDAGEANADAELDNSREDTGASSKSENRNQEGSKEEGGGEGRTSRSEGNGEYVEQPSTRKKFGKSAHHEVDSAEALEVDHADVQFLETGSFPGFDENDPKAVERRREAIENGVEAVHGHGPSVLDVLEEVQFDVSFFFFFCTYFFLIYFSTLMAHVEALMCNQLYVMCLFRTLG